METVCLQNFPKMGLEVIFAMIFDCFGRRSSIERAFARFLSFSFK